MSQEVELRFTARAEDLARLARTRTLKRYVDGRARTHRLSTTYFDTPDLAIAKAGLSLRVRKKGHLFVQTVKGTNAGALASDRIECETLVPDLVPDISAVPDENLREKLHALMNGTPIEPKIETGITRTTRCLRTDDGDEIELAFDRGEIRTLADTRTSVPVAEIELELKRGSVGALYRVARELAAHAPLVVTTESKAERGLRAIEGRGPAPRKAGRLSLAPDATAEDAFRTTLFHCLRHVAQNACVVRAGDAEGVHQIRVGLRRLRAALTAFGDAFRDPVLDELGLRAKSLANRFGDTRELDVFATELLPPVEASGPRAALAALRLALAHLRENSWAESRALVQSAAFTDFVLDLAAAADTGIWRENATPEAIAAFDRPARALAREALDKRVRKARKRAKHLGKLTPPQRHRLRIALKKLRYAAEFYAPLFDPEDVGPYLKKLSKAQDVFGMLNDTSTAQAILARVLAHAETAISDDLREGAMFVAGWHQGRVEPAWRKAMTRWKDLKKTKPFWT